MTQRKGLCVKNIAKVIVTLNKSFSRDPWERDQEIEAGGFKGLRYSAEEGEGVCVCVLGMGAAVLCDLR